MPKIPSMRIVDLAEAIAPGCEQEIVGIRPGEKVHELLITRDDARLTLEFDDFFIIKPSIHMWNPTESGVYGGEQGRPVADDFEYASNTNDRWFTVDRLRELVETSLDASLSRLWAPEHRSRAISTPWSRCCRAIFSPRARRSSGSRRRSRSASARGTRSRSATARRRCTSPASPPVSDRVTRGLTAAITFAASANCLRYAGAEVGFVDIDPDTLRMSSIRLEAGDRRAAGCAGCHSGASRRPGAQHAGGARLAKRRIVIEDAAQAFGATYENGKPVGCGAHSDLTIFSFHPVKTITTGEGGAVVTNDGELAHRLRMLRSHGMEREAARFIATDATEDGQVKPWFHEQQMLGFNYRMTDIQAALGLSQLSKLDRFLDRRRAIAARYDAAFSQLPHVRLPQTSAGERTRSALHLYIAMIDFMALGITRAALMTRLAKAGVGSQVHYIPVYRHPYYAQRYAIELSKFPQAERYYAGCLSLPLFPDMTDDDVEHVIETVREVVSGA